MTLAIGGMIIDAVNDYLTDLLHDQVDSNDPTRAGLVRPGLLQDDPTQYIVSVLTFPNDPDSPNTWKHEVVAKGNDDNHNPPSYEIGSGEMWYRRFTTQVEMFYKPSVDRDDSRNYSAVILARTERALRHMPLGLGEDDFGEEPIELRVKSSNITQGGGEGQFIWYVNIWFEVLTGIDNL